MKINVMLNLKPIASFRTYLRKEVNIMQRIIRTTTTAAATVALLAGVLTNAAFADTDIDVIGNGAGSLNTVDVSSSHDTVVGQSNVTEVDASVYSTAHTGANKANGNTDADVSIDTGDATSTATVSVGGSANVAHVSPCGCPPDHIHVTVSGNGEGSTNTVTTSVSSTLAALQSNFTGVSAYVKSKAKTGKNKANNNTGGTVGITTGDATSTSGVTVSGSTNTFP